jgi:hypothetical protein
MDEESTVPLPDWGRERGFLLRQRRLPLNDTFITKTPSLEESEFLVFGGYDYAMRETEF